MLGPVQSGRAARGRATLTAAREVGTNARQARRARGVTLLCALLLAGCVAGMTAISFAALSRRFPRSAGEAVYVREGFGISGLATATGLAVVLVGMCSLATMTVGMMASPSSPSVRLTALLEPTITK